MRMHRKVWLWSGKKPIPWAVQLYVNKYVSLGMHIDFSRPLLDIHLGWFIVAIGVNPSVTARIDRYRHTCRGFQIAGNQEDQEAVDSPLVL